MRRKNLRTMAKIPMASVGTRLAMTARADHYDAKRETAMQIDKYLPSLRDRTSVIKRASPGERVMASLFPARLGTPGSWGGQALRQVAHMKNWCYVAIDAICCKMASITPNLAYVVDQPIPGRTTKACQRGLMNMQGRGFGGSPVIGSGSLVPYDSWHPDTLASFGQADGGHSWLTMGELRSKALSVVKPHEELEPLEADHPLRRLIENPNPVDTYFDIEYELQMFEELCGVSYEWIIPNKAGIPCERWCIPSHWVWPRTGGGKYVGYDVAHADELIAYYEIRPWGIMGSAGTLFLPANEVIMSRWKSPIDKIAGYSKLSAICQWIDLEESYTTSQWSQVQNVARPEFWVELGPGYEDPNDDRIARIEAKFLAKFQGEFNYGKPIITPPGSKLNVLSFSPSEMAYGESEERIRDRILSTWRIPPAIVGIVKEMTFGSILATMGGFCAWCLNPRLVMRGLTRTKHLASRWDEPGRRCRLWYDDCVPADPAQVNADIASDLSASAITPNEVRSMRGRKPYRLGGNNPMIQGPGGIMPYPMNEKEKDDLAEMIGQFTQAAAGPQQGQPGAGGPMPGMGGEQPPEGQPESTEGEEDPLAVLGLGEEEEPIEADAGIEEPNGKPQKSWSGHRKEKELDEIVRTSKSLREVIERGKDLLGIEKEGGTCKPGERADLTGCTPATHTASGKKPPAQRSHEPVELLKNRVLELLTSAKVKVSDAALTLYRKLPAAIMSPANVELIQAVHHALEPIYTSGQKLARTVAQEQGVPEDHVERVGRVLAMADSAARWTANVPIVHQALHFAGGPVAIIGSKVGFYVPVASLAYIGYALTGQALKRLLTGEKKNPVQMIQAARQRMKAMKEADHADNG